MRPLAVLFLLPAPLAGQERQWKVPVLGAVEYRVERAGQAEKVRNRHEALRTEPEGSAREWLPHMANAPWLLWSELAEDRRALGDPPVELREVVRAVAFDLRGKGRARFRFPRLAPFGDLRAGGRREVLADGRERFELRVVRADPEPLGFESRADFNRWVEPRMRRPCEGFLEVVRRFDPVRGVVTEYEGVLRLAIEREEGWTALRISESAELVAVHEHRDADFRAAVSEAIEKGGAWVRGRLGNLERRSLRREDEGSNRTYNSGRLALGLLTMVKAGLPRDDEVVVAALEELRRRELVDTYSLAAAIMAMEAWYAPPNERQDLIDGVLEEPAPRGLSEEDREVMEGWRDRLLGNIDTRVDAGYRLRFNYVAGPRYDHSVNQYGLLGLYSAHLCDVPVPATVWRSAANHLVEATTTQSFPKVVLRLETYADLRDGGGDRRTRSGGRRVPMAGWTYRGRSDAFGSMTCAGIAGLAICREGLGAHGLGRSDLMPKVRRALDSGFAWLQEYFSVRRNPGMPGRWQRHRLYYLYSLERACELAGVARIGGRDWFHEGALQLLWHQRGNGSFHNAHRGQYTLEATCFAVLFLKRAAQPTAYTGKGDQGGVR